MEGSGDFGKKLGLLGNFVLVRPCAMEAPKTQYGLKKFMILNYGWLGMYFSDIQKLT